MRMTKLAVVVLASMVIAANLTAATTYYVRPGGSDSNCSGLADANDPGTGSAPRSCAFSSPRGCISHMGSGAGDSCLIHGGTYTGSCSGDSESAVFEFRGKGGTSANYAVVKGFDGETATVCVGSGTTCTYGYTGCRAIGLRNTTSYLRFENLHVVGTLGIGASDAAGAVHHITVTKNDLEGGGSVCDGNYAAMRVEAAGNIQIDHNYIHDLVLGGCGDTRLSGIKMFQTKDNVIEYNTVRAGNGPALRWGVDFKQCIQGAIVRYNLFKTGMAAWNVQSGCYAGGVAGGDHFYGNIVDCREPGSCRSGVDSGGVNTSNEVFDHNTFVNVSFSIWSEDSSRVTGVTFRDNIVQDPSSADMSNENAAILAGNWGNRSGYVFDNNAYDPGGRWYGDTTYTTLSSWSSAFGSGQETHSQAVHCTFQDFANGDFHITGGPCKTASSTGQELGVYGAATCVGHQCGTSTTCGNGTVEAGEQCDGSNLNGQTCQSLGYSGGTLACNSGSCTFNTSGCTTAPPPAPTALQASAVSYSEVDLSWTDTSSNETGFKVDRKTGATGTWAQIGTTAANVSTYRDLTVNGSTPYTYRVSSFNAGGDSADSNEASATTPAPPGPSTGLMGYWKFDEGSGTTAGDSSGNLNSATLVNGTTWTSGKVNSALSFDGVTNYAQVTDSPSIDLGSQGTIVAWIKRGSTGAWGSIVSKGTANSNSSQNYAMEFNTANQLEMKIGNGSSANVLATPALTDTANFHQVAFVWNGAQLVSYLDGVQNGTGTQTLTPTSNGAVLLIGQYSPSGSNQDPYRGVVDEVRIYNRPLSSQEILDLYNGAGGGTDTTPPVRSNGAPTGALPVGTTQTTLSLTTNENATCKYGTTPNTAYASLPSTFSTTGGTSHSTAVSGLQNGGNYNYYVRCQDVAGNSNPDDYLITFSVSSGTPTGALECSNWRTSHPEWIWCDDFEDDASLEANYFDVTRNNGGLGVSTADSYGGSHSLRFHYTQGQEGAGWMWRSFGRSPVQQMSDPSTDFQEVWYRFYIKMAPGWTGNPQKVTRTVGFYASDWSEFFMAHFWQDQNPTANGTSIDPVSCTSGSNPVCVGYNDFAHMTWLGYRNGVTAIYAPAEVGQWRCLEAHVKLNTAGQSNGVQEYWIDGVLQASRSDLNFRGSYTGYGINAIQLEGFWNGGAAATEDKYYDNFVISRQRVGCGAGPGTNPDDVRNLQRTDKR